MARDNHNGPNFDWVKKQYPQAIRFHWFQNAFDRNDRYWMVGTLSECADGLHRCMVWENVKQSLVEQA